VFRIVYLISSIFAKNKNQINMYSSEAQKELFKRLEALRRYL